MRPSAAVGPLALLLALGACTKATSWKDVGFEEQNLARESNSDVDLPVGLWDKLEEIGVAGGGGEPVGGEHGGGGGGAPGGKRVTEFTPVKAYLYEKTPGLLGSRAIALAFGEGGGEIDFAKYLAPDRRGSFYVAVAFPDELKDEPFRAYFLSDAPARKIGGQRYGAGCRDFYDVTSFFQKSMSGPGILVNTTEMRHAFALGGTLFLGYVKNKALKLAQLTFRDSRAAETASCRPSAEKN